MSHNHGDPQFKKNLEKRHNVHFCDMISKVKWRWIFFLFPSTLRLLAFAFCCCCQDNLPSRSSPRPPTLTTSTPAAPATATSEKINTCCYNQSSTSLKSASAIAAPPSTQRQVHPLPASTTMTSGPTLYAVPGSSSASLYHDDLRPHPLLNARFILCQPLPR